MPKTSKYPPFRHPKFWVPRSEKEDLLAEAESMVTSHPGVIGRLVEIYRYVAFSEGGTCVVCQQNVQVYTRNIKMPVLRWFLRVADEYPYEPFKVDETVRQFYRNKAVVPTQLEICWHLGLMSPSSKKYDCEAYPCTGTSETPCPVVAKKGAHTIKRGVYQLTDLGRDFAAGTAPVPVGYLSYDKKAWRPRTDITIMRDEVEGYSTFSSAFDDDGEE